MRYLLVTLWLAVCVPVQAGTQVRFCYEDKDAPPFIHGEGQQVPVKNPGLSIELMRKIDEQLARIEFIYYRKPWNRCLHELKEGLIDAVIASHRKAREDFIAYPMTIDNSIAKQYATSRNGSCYLYSKNRAKPLQLNKNLTIAVPRGYAVKGAISANYSVLETDSFLKAIFLVEKGLVDATIGLCQIGNTKLKLPEAFDQLQAKYPPFEISYGFIGLSMAFYENNTQASWQIWQASQQIDLDQMYQAYLLQQSSP